MTATRSGRRACPWSTSIEERDHPPPGRTCGGSSVEPDFANFYLHAMVTTVCRDRDRRDRLRLQPRPKQPAPGLECVEREPDFGPCRRDIEARLVELPRQTRVRRPDMHVIRAIASTHDEAHTGCIHARRSVRIWMKPPLLAVLTSPVIRAWTLPRSSSKVSSPEEMPPITPSVKNCQRNAGSFSNVSNAISAAAACGVTAPARTKSARRIDFNTMTSSYRTRRRIESQASGAERLRRFSGRTAPFPARQSDMLPAAEVEQNDPGCNPVPLGLGWGAKAREAQSLS